MRINLSEQTDVSDLMGSDIPIPDESVNASSGVLSSGSFKWVDGVLLQSTTFHTQESIALPHCRKRTL